MNKSKLAVGLMTAVLATGVLAGCDNTVKYASDGSIIVAYDENNNPIIDLKASDLLKDYYKDSSKYQSIFDAIYSIVVQNYFTKDEPITLHRPTGDVTIHLGKDQAKEGGEIDLEAKRRTESDKTDAQENATNNKTNYKEEFKKILASKGVEDEDELYKKYVEEVKKETFDKNFYKYHMDQIKNGDPSFTYTVEGETDPRHLWSGYFDDMLPYHVSHILYKIEDSSGTNYSNGTISEENAKGLYQIVNLLKEGEDSFGQIAYDNKNTGDTGSANNYGDLGIMDYSTGYVNEFKLGIFAYENFFGNHKDEAKASNIGIDDKIAGNLNSVIQGSFYNNAIPTIDFEIFKELDEVADVVKEKDTEKSVIDDIATFYPRNIIYNKYLNRHTAAFITYKNATADDIIDPANPGNKTSGFVAMSLNGTDLNVLCAKTAGGFTPIICARAGSGDYQGIHFILVNRSPFDGEGDDKVVAGVSLNDYYTTYYPEQLDYPTDSEGKKLNTYVNFSGSTKTVDTQTRASSLESTMKSYDSERLNKYIYKYFFKLEGIKLADEDLDKALDKWIYRSLEKKDKEKDESWEKTWNDYVDTLKKQNSERTKLVSEACRIAYLNGNSKAKIADAKVDQLKDSLFEQMRNFILEEVYNREYYKSYREEYAKNKAALMNDEDAKAAAETAADTKAKAAAELEVLEKLGSGKVLVDGALKSEFELAKALNPDLSSKSESDYPLLTESDLFKKEGGLCNDGKDRE